MVNGAYLEGKGSPAEKGEHHLTREDVGSRVCTVSRRNA